MSAYGPQNCHPTRQPTVARKVKNDIFDGALEKGAVFAFLACSRATETPVDSMRLCTESVDGKTVLVARKRAFFLQSACASSPPTGLAHN